MSDIVVAGDAHLGADTADSTAFEAFLRDLYVDRDGIAEVVLLGDVWDMIRRDAFGVAFEHPEVIDALTRLADALPVTHLYGNHDGALRALDNDRYPLALQETYTTTQAGTRFRFVHGHTFDRLQIPRLSRYLSGPGDRGEIDPTAGRKDRVVAAARDAVRTAKTGVTTLVGDGGHPPYPRRERRAHAHVTDIPADKLVYGHTHRPYIHASNTVANPGSWTTTAPTANTYLRITDGDIALYRYHADAPDRRLPDRPEI